jgi:hypothetical protein
MKNGALQAAFQAGCWGTIVRRKTRRAIWIYTTGAITCGSADTGPVKNARFAAGAFPSGPAMKSRNKKHICN